MTALHQRMVRHKPGQVTWPEPELGRKCVECDHFSTAGVKRPGKGRCVLVKAHQRVDGVLFDGEAAIACPQFREVRP